MCKYDHCIYIYYIILLYNINIYTLFDVMPAHIKERVSWGAAKRELVAHMCKWDMAFPRVTTVIDLGVTSDQHRVFKAERLTAEESSDRAKETQEDNTCPWETDSGIFEIESVGASSCTTEALPNTSPPKKRRVM